VRLHLGVVDVPYVASSGRSNRRRGKGTRMTTGGVAAILESRYGIMETFFNAHSRDIVGAMESSLSGAMENLLLGAPTAGASFGSATSEIEREFRMFLSNREMDGQPGIPTQAALMGVNRRLKVRRGAMRPSFVDTGLFSSNFTAWVSDDSTTST
jgi:hypothetical protein